MINCTTFSVTIYSPAKKRNTMRPGVAIVVRRDTNAEIRDVPGNTILLATLGIVHHCYSYANFLVTVIFIKLYCLRRCGLECFLIPLQESDAADFLEGAERENTQHVTIGYLTDEKPKSVAKTKSNAKRAENHSDDKTSQSARSQPLDSTRSSDGDTARKSREMPKFPGALSVTARWGAASDSLVTGLMTRRVTFSSDTCKSADDQRNGYSSAEETTTRSTNSTVADRNRKKKSTKKKLSEFLQKGKRDKKLSSSLDASILRDALGSSGIESEAAVGTSSLIGENERLSSTVDDESSESSDIFVPPLDLIDVMNTPRSILR